MSDYRAHYCNAVDGRVMARRENCPWKDHGTEEGDGE